MPTDDLTIVQYPVTPALGRHMVTDRRSLAYRRHHTDEPIKPVEWAPKIPVLDQEDLLAQGIRLSEMFAGVEDLDALGSCTANAATAILSVLLTDDECAAAGLDTKDAVAAERFAIGLYAEATVRDEWMDQQWPSDDCGSSGLGVVKALRDRGLIDQYGHATTADEFAMLLQTGPVLMGVPWYRAWFEPVGASALLDDIPNWADSPIDGGHEIACIALEDVKEARTGGLDYDRTILRIRNSWTETFGDAGCFRMSLGLYQSIRQQTDLIQPRIEGVRP